MISNEDAEPQVGGVIESDKKVSWRAYREADTANEFEWIEPLIKIIEEESSEKARRAAYFVLGKISKNTNSDAAVNFLADRAYKETDRYLSSSIYDLLAEISKSDGFDISTLKLAVIDEDSLIRHSAIRALQWSRNPEVEDILISISDSSDDPFDVIYANAALNRSGTVKALSTLEKHIKSRKKDVAISATLAIQEITKRLEAK